MDKMKKYKYITDYKKQKYARILLEVQPEEKELWKAAAAARGLSLQRFVRAVVNATVADEMMGAV